MSIQYDRKIYTYSSIPAEGVEVLVPVLQERSVAYSEKIMSATDVQVTVSKNATVIMRPIDATNSYFNGMSNSLDYCKYQLKAGESVVLSNDGDTINNTTMQVGSVKVYSTDTNIEIIIACAINRR